MRSIVPTDTILLSKSPRNRPSKTTMAPSTTFSSSGAICTLTVSTPLLQGDAVLQLILNLASDKQVKVSQQKKGNDLKLEMLDASGVLTQRAAILRALAGPALHYALDIDLLGGYGASSKNGGSMTSVMAMSSLQSWMTVAHQVTVGATDKAAIIAQLETYLETKAFLIPSSQSTLADMDLCAALLKAKKDEDAAFPSNVMRWMTTVHAQMTSLGATNLASIDPLATSFPAFFYGTEEFAALGKKTGAPAAPAGGKPAAAAGGKPAAAGGGADGLSEEQKKAATEKRAQKAAEKSAKKKQKAPAAPPTPAADLDITALDIRVGKIVKAWHHADAEKLFCEEVDLGEESGPRQIASGLRPFYATEDLTGRHVLVLCNLKSRNLVGFPSHGMVLCASNADHTKVEFVVPPTDAAIGERISFGSLKGDPEPENKVAKKKFAEKLLPDLKTNASGEVMWKEHAAMTTKGAVKAVNGMADAMVG
jgi:aminoacyl tRNA synthase complex-interacting multifunctional protein 1